MAAPQQRGGLDGARSKRAREAPGTRRQETQRAPNRLDCRFGAQVAAEGHPSATKAIETHADFQQHNGMLFTELTGLTRQLQAIEHLLEPAGCIPSFLGEFRTVEHSAAFAEKDVWKQLQSHKAQASLELTPLLDG